MTKKKRNRPKFFKDLKAKSREYTNYDDGKVHIYTDGSCSRSDGSGGWGAVLIKGDYRKHISGGVKDTTIGAMELRAAYEAIKCMTHFEDPVIVYSDSQYLVNALTLWWRGWERNGWTTAQGKDVKNLDLIRKILDLVENKPVAFRWVKGHSNVEGNEIADHLAGTARRELLMLDKYKENFRAMANSTPVTLDQWREIADRHIKGLKDIDSHENGWACKHPIMLWTYYLASSYLYYEEDKSLLPDMEFDNLCRYLLKLGKDTLMESGCYWVDKLFDADAMSSGTGYHLVGKFPIGIQNIALSMTKAMGYRPAEFSTDPTNYIDRDPTQPKRKTRTRTRSTGDNVGESKVRVRTRKRTSVKSESTEQVTPKRTRRRVRA